MTEPSTQAPPRLKTECVYPPIPDRRFDWQAYAEDAEFDDPSAYDGVDFIYDPPVVGRGATEAAAVADFWEQWKEKYGE